MYAAAGSGCYTRFLLALVRVHIYTRSAPYMRLRQTYWLKKGCGRTEQDEPVAHRE